MKNTREILAWLLIASPYVYLASIWQSLPETVPIHFNSNGPDGWSSRLSLLGIPCVMPLGIYLLMTIVPYLDPKGKLRDMGPKLPSLRFALTFFIAALSLYALHCTYTTKFVEPTLLFVILGLLFAFLGNYFQTVRPNYFVGIRTPWTLENEEVWKATHRMGGRLWVGGGLLMVLLSLIVKPAFMEMMLAAVVTPLAVIPIVYSYLLYRRHQKTLNDQ